jgi:methylthioribose-1-phosphate isomerase
VPASPPLRALRFDRGVLRAIDQTLLPHQQVELELRDAADVADAIRRLAIRGAPLIGVAAAYGVALELQAAAGGAAAEADALHRALAVLAASRPTAVNLTWALDQVRRAVLAAPAGSWGQAAHERAQAIEADEEQRSALVAAHGADLLADARCLMTHCNTGALAAPGEGTALAVIAELARRGRLQKVLVCESRPLLQGARLTVLELSRLGIAHELIADSAVAGLLAAGEAQGVVLGCDRVAANGDVANKVGTLGLALAAAHAGIPFVVAGPVSTIDFATPSGAEIVVEERDAEEVRTAAGVLLTLPGTPCRNPAFDVTPAHLITALVTDRGAARPVNADALAALLGREATPQTPLPAGTPGAR